ncbi:MAG: MBL fold metallo-hydrolase [Methanimicrococcus sp.]|nr:MBL fold metallo-hydrolase [Methanimicrococcus sp.]
MTIQYLSNPMLPIIKDGWAGNPMKGRSFINLRNKKTMSFMKFLKWRYYKNAQREERRNDTFQVSFFKNESFMDVNQDMIVWLGHASFFIRLGGVTFLTDPAYFNFPMRSRRVPTPCDIEKFKFADYVLISHMHHDHADPRSLRQIFKGNRKTQMLAPLKSSNILKYLTHGSRNIQEAGWFQKFDTPPSVEVYFLPAFHWSRMHAFDSNRSLWGSFIIRGNGKTIYFGGDTAWSDHFFEIAELFPDIDYAIMPIGAYKPRSIMGDSHLSPDETVLAANALNAKNLIPMHYGTYPMGFEPIGEPYRDICKMKEYDQISCALNLLGVGEELFI